MPRERIRRLGDLCIGRMANLCRRGFSTGRAKGLVRRSGRLARPVMMSL
jgi:hypothetical protein